MQNFIVFFACIGLMIVASTLFIDNNYGKSCQESCLYI